MKASRLPLCLALLALIACGGKSASPSPEPVRNDPVNPLATLGIAGEKVIVTPLTLIVPDAASLADTLLANRAAALTWSDSTILAALNARAPEVKWIGPVELRKVARRSPTVAPDPDRMGQAIMRAKFEDVPDPFRTHLRQMVALAGGRLALVPAALVFSQDPDGQFRAELAMTLADSRTAKVVWRTVAWGVAESPERALIVALETVLPVGLGSR